MSERQQTEEDGEPASVEPSEPTEPNGKTEQELLSQARWSLGGMEFFRRMIRGELPVPPLPRLFGFRLVEVVEGRATFTADPKVEFYNGLGSVHGGFAATLLDTALGCVVNTMAPPGKAFATVELKVTLVSALRKETGQVRCEAQTIHVGGRIATAEARIVDAAGRIYAHGTATCMAVDGPGGARA